MKTGLGIIRDMEIRFQGYSVELIDRDEELPAIVDWAESIKFFSSDIVVFYLIFSMPKVNIFS